MRMRNADQLSLVWKNKMAQHDGILINLIFIFQINPLNMSGSSSRQNQMVADEMFPDGPGALDFVDVEDGVRWDTQYRGGDSSFIFGLNITEAWDSRASLARVGEI